MLRKCGKPVVNSVVVAAAAVVVRRAEKPITRVGSRRWNGGAMVDVDTRLPARSQQARHPSMWSPSILDFNHCYPPYCNRFTFLTYLSFFHLNIYFFFCVHISTFQWRSLIDVSNKPCVSLSYLSSCSLQT